MQAAPLIRQDTGLTLSPPPPYEPESREASVTIPSFAQVRPIHQEPVLTVEAQTPEESTPPSESSSSSHSASSLSSHSCTSSSLRNGIESLSLEDNTICPLHSSDEALSILPSSTNKTKKRIGDPLEVQLLSSSRLPTLKESPIHSEPFAIPGRGSRIGDGFKPYFPSTFMVKHDVTSVDWKKFLENIEVAGSLSSAQKWKARALGAPLLLVGDPFGSYFIGKAIENKWRLKKEPLVINTIELWAKEFFVPRGLDVFVVQGAERLSSTSPGGVIPSGFNPEQDGDLSKGGQPLSLLQAENVLLELRSSSRASDPSRSSLSSSSSPSSSSSSRSMAEVFNSALSRDELRSIKRERKVERREKKRVRRAERRAAKFTSTRIERRSLRKEHKAERRADRMEWRRVKREGRRAVKATKNGKGRCCGRQEIVHYLVVQSLAGKEMDSL